MFDVILAIDQNNGIWCCPEEIEIFKHKTVGGCLIVDQRTAKCLPELEDCGLIIISPDPDMSSLEDAIKVAFDEAEEFVCRGPTFVIGGAEIYEHVFSSRYREWIETVHLVVMKRTYECREWVEFNPRGMVITHSGEHTDFVYYEIEYRDADFGEWQYMDVLRRVLNNGQMREGRNGNTLSTFVEHMKFDLRDGFPLMTTKRTFFRGIVEEFLMFFRGETDTSALSEKKVRIWEGNTSREFLDSTGHPDRAVGQMGPMYGYQWRFFGAEYDESSGQPVHAGVDQITNVVRLIRTDPHSRRILLTTYNPAQAEEGVLYPCHSVAVQFYVDGEFLDMFCMNRSNDILLGTPFNIASSALLLTVVAAVTGKTARRLSITMGDTHIYEAHLKVVRQQLRRIPFTPPRLAIHRELREITDVERLVYDDFEIVDYQHHAPLTASMVV